MKKKKTRHRFGVRDLKHHHLTFLLYGLQAISISIFPIPVLQMSCISMYLSDVSQIFSTKGFSAVNEILQMRTQRAIIPTHQV